MIVRRFLLWAREAPAGDRAEAVGALARAYLYSDLSAEDRWEAETALTSMLDDRAACVRLAMAEVLGASERAPRHLIVALAGDQGDVASIVLARSPLLADGDLVDCAALGDARAQSAVASRPWLSAAVSGALAEVACPDALVVLARNHGAEIAGGSLSRMIERCGDHPVLRESLLGRPDLPVDIAQAIVAALAHSLRHFVVGCGWLSAERSERVVREARERSAVALSARDEAETDRLVSYLRRSDQLTPALILRAVLSGNLAFAAQAFADLAEMAPRRAMSLLLDRRGTGFRALYARAGLPALIRPAFEAALAAHRDSRDPAGLRPVARLSRPVVQRALAACEAMPPHEAGRLVALLRRLDVEAALDDAREIADGLADDAALQIVLRHAPGVLLDGPATIAA